MWGGSNKSICPTLLSGFHIHQAVGKTAGSVLVRLADSLVLPLNCSDYAEVLEDYLEIALLFYEDQLLAQNISMGKQFHVPHGTIQNSCKVLKRPFFIKIVEIVDMSLLSLYQNQSNAQWPTSAVQLPT